MYINRWTKVIFVYSDIEKRTSIDRQKIFSIQILKKCTSGDRQDAH